MFIGHYALALGAKRAAPRTSLGVLFAAAQLVDLIWPILLLVGVERVTPAPGAAPFLRLDFTWYPWTHSLVMALVWAVVAGGAYLALTRYRTGAVVVAALVASHWLLDYVVHVPDLPLVPGGSARFGLGLWHSVAGTVAVEGTMFVAGMALYAATTRARDRVGRWGFWALVVAIVAIYASSIDSPAPPDARSVGWFALLGWLIPLWAWWADRHRNVAGRVPAPAARVTSAA